MMRLSKKYCDLSVVNWDKHYWSVRHWQITIFCDNRVTVYHSINKLRFHTLITSWQLREVICHFFLKNVASITHEQNIACSKTLKTAVHMSRPLFLKAVICRSSGGLSANGNKEKMHRMTIRVNYTLATCGHVNFQDSSFVQYGNEDMMLMALSSWVLESIYGRIEVCIQVNSSFKLITSFSTSTMPQINGVPL